MTEPTTQSRERPILFNGAMVRALLAGTKTQARRIARVTNTMGRDSILALRNGNAHAPTFLLPEQAHLAAACCPCGVSGDRLWVREAWARTAIYQAVGQDMVVYRECDNRTDYGGPWKPGIHMFRRDSRILLEISEVRVERLNSISEADARAEGITDGGCTTCGNPEPCGCDKPTPSAIDAYCSLWDEINGVGAWAANPWVWAVSFKVIKP